MDSSDGQGYVPLTIIGSCAILGAMMEDDCIAGYCNGNEGVVCAICCVARHSAVGLLKMPHRWLKLASCGMHRGESNEKKAYLNDR